MQPVRVLLTAAVLAAISMDPGAGAATVESSGLTQCLRAYAAHFQNTPADGRAIRRGAWTWRLGISEHVAAATVDVFVHRGRDGYRHRVYLLRAGTKPLSDRRTASRHVVENTRSQGDARDYVLFDTNTRANHHRLDRICLNLRQP